MCNLHDANIKKKISNKYKIVFLLTVILWNYVVQCGNLDRYFRVISTVGVFKKNEIFTCLSGY